jgi:tetratricopeptide (TPR) repeat protein
MGRKGWLPSALALGVLLIGSATAEVRNGSAAAPRVGAPLRHKHVGGHAKWCALHFLEREYRLGIEDCDEALVEDPTDADSYSNRGGAYLMINEPDRAILDFETAIRLKPGDVLLHYNLAGARMQKREYEKALASYSEAIRLNPGLGPAYNNRGYALELLGQREKAIADYRRALELAPALSDAIRKNLRRLGAE